MLFIVVNMASPGDKFRNKDFYINGIHQVHRLVLKFKIIHRHNAAGKCFQYIRIKCQ